MSYVDNISLISLEQLFMFHGLFIYGRTWQDNAVTRPQIHWKDGPGDRAAENGAVAA